jgi:hypothetical protein
MIPRETIPFNVGYLDKILLAPVLGEELELFGVDGTPPLLSDQLHRVLRQYRPGHTHKEAGRGLGEY